MKKRVWIVLSVCVLVATAVFYGYERWTARSSSARGELLDSMPADASVVVFIDLAELRAAPFFARLYSWAPKPSIDSEYAQFIKDTGFDYERDLQRLAIAFEKHGESSTFFVIADGKFERQKISALALKTGTVTKASAGEIFSVPVSGSAKRISFTFLQSDRIVLTDGSDLANALDSRKRSADAEWSSRFDRLGGSPIFAVIRQDAAPGSALATQAPGGLWSPQLSALLDQLQWITIAGKPENDRLRLIAEGESLTDATARQLADILNGLLTLAEAGLNDGKTRRQLDPALRASYLELLKTTEVSKIDRGDMKSVRLTLEITPAFMESVRRAAPEGVSPSPSPPLPANPPASRKGHT